MGTHSLYCDEVFCKIGGSLQQLPSCWALQGKGSLADAAEAHRLLEKGDVHEKLVLEVE